MNEFYDNPDAIIYSLGWIPCEECGCLIPLDSMGNPYQHTCNRHTVTVTVPESITDSDRLELDEWWEYI